MPYSPNHPHATTQRNSNAINFKQAFANDIIIDGQIWIDMLENRNVMAHVYDEDLARETVCRICRNYMSALQQLHDFLVEKAS